MATYFERHGALHVAGTRLVDAADRPVQLRGVSTLGLAWYPEFVNEAAFRTLRDDWGANTVRLAMYTCEEGGYMTGGDKAGLEALIDKSSPLYESLFIEYLADDAAREEKLLDNPGLFRTPIVRNGKQATLGYQPDVWQTWD